MITMSLAKLIDFWFANEQLWFNCKPADDIYIAEQFGFLIQQDLNIDHFKQKLHCRLILGLILVYDQIIRHVYRGNAEKIKVLSYNGLQLALYLLDNDLIDDFTPAQQCFIMMPLRHTFELNYLNRVYDLVNDRNLKNPNKYYLRFLKATMIARSPLLAASICPEAIDNNITDSQLYNILDENCIKNFREIKPIHTTNPIYRQFKETMQKLANVSKIVISLSGGVDSMISSAILNQLTKKNHTFQLIAVHINYANRPDNNLEVEFVKRWCALLGIDCYVRHITELHRDRSNDRNDYEDITRKFRFDMYKVFNAPVFLGHNQDDCVENIFRNISQERSCGNLMGMEAVSIQDGVKIVRPMLGISKREIKEFAKSHHIPHLPNSTPSWSQRGMIREQLIPSIDNFDPAIVMGLLKMASNMKQIYDSFDTFAIKNFISQNIIGTKIMLLENANEKSFGFIFWKNIVHHVFDQYQLKRPSNKAIDFLISKLETNTFGRINMTKSTFFIYTRTHLELRSGV